ncbi:MAG: hypothetical protein KBD53_02835 [Candidatus Omnitrophica bacterium]|nr:hypothetical protein [Candidatus Omnitrophota bacterium]
MLKTEFCNAGSIHDIPIGKGKRFNIGTDHFAIFRETFGHFYVFADEATDAGKISNGVIEGHKIKLTNGHTVDLHTGRYDNTNHFIPSLNSWVENGFILILAAGVLN